MTMILNCKLCGGRFYANTEHVCPSDHARIVELLEKILDRMPEREPLPDFVERRPDRDGFNLRHWKPGPHTFGVDCPCGPERVPHKQVLGKPTPADDFPGEPVEPGDLRAGDRIEYDYEGLRYSSVLVRHPNVASALCSEIHDWDGSTTNITSGPSWCAGISNVRLIERAPREDEDPDVVLAEAMHDRWQRKMGWSTLYSLDELNERHRSTWTAVARAAREHIHLTDRRYESDLGAIERASDAIARATKAEAERDEWKAMYEALRADVADRHRGANSILTRGELRGILDRDDERVASGSDSES